MGAITNLIRTAGDFFNSTEEDQFTASRKGTIYKKNTKKEWHPYEEELELQRVPLSYKYDDDSDDEDETVNEWERFFIAKRKNAGNRDRILVTDVVDAYRNADFKQQAHVPYMIDDDGSVVKM